MVAVAITAVASLVTIVDAGHSGAAKAWEEYDDPCQTSLIDTVRIDQWLHAVRLAKTRSDAAAACRGGHVDINGKAAKPASAVKVGDRVEAHLSQRQRIVDVTRVISKRVGASVAAECFDDHSPPPPERDGFRPLFAERDRGTGRPTKRDRRKIDRLRGERR